MWTPLQDPNIALRESSLEVLHWSLRFIRERSESSDKLFLIIFNDATDVLVKGKQLPEQIHGALLTLIELLSASTCLLPDTNPKPPATTHPSSTSSSSAS